VSSRQSGIPTDIGMLLVADIFLLSALIADNKRRTDENTLENLNDKVINSLNTHFIPIQFEQVFLSP
jgi:hypothetical protein